MKAINYEGKDYKVFHINDEDGSAEVILVPLFYGNGTLAIRLLALETRSDEEGFYEPLIPWATLTVNLDPYTGLNEQSDTLAYVDVNNNGPEVLEIIEENGLGTATGRYARSGFCMYPLYQFNKEAFYAEQ